MGGYVGACLDECFKPELKCTWNSTNAHTKGCTHKPPSPKNSRALREQKSATAAAEAAAREARASASTAAAALEDRSAVVERLQDELQRVRLDAAAVEERAQWEVEAIRADARRELETAMQTVQLLTLKQKRLVGALQVGWWGDGERRGVMAVSHECAGQMRITILRSSQSVLWYRS